MIKSYCEYIGISHTYQHHDMNAETSLQIKWLQQ